MMRLVRKNMMWKVVFAFVFAVLLGCMPTTVLAETVGAFEVTGGVNGTDYSYENGVLTILSDTEITIANTDPATPTTDRIEVEKGVSANIILKGVNIDVSSKDKTVALKIADNSEGNVKLTLFDGTESILKSGKYCAGLQKNGTVGTLEITGSGMLTATGGYCGAGIGGGDREAGSNITISGGSVTATGGDYGAGIGGGFVGAGSNIAISGGSITATGGDSGAGIGGGDSGVGSNITISGGSVKVIAGDRGNEIGGGYGKDALIPIDADGNNDYLIIVPNPDNETVTIDGKEYSPSIHSEEDRSLYVYLCGSPVIMVGSKEYKYKDLIEFDIIGGVDDLDYRIEGDVVKILTSTELTIANKVDVATTTNRIVIADGVSANIILKGVNIDVSGFYNKAAFEIADGSAGDVKVTLFEGTESILKSGERRAGLQKNGTVGTLEIAGNGMLIAIGGSSGAGIGGGYSGTARNITISGGRVTATGGFYGAGIGGGDSGVGSNIAISGGSIIATGGFYGAGIGGGDSGVGSNIKISGGSITATGGDSGAGIGGGFRGAGSRITISGGSVTAIAESHIEFTVGHGGIINIYDYYGGAGIGGGYEGTGDEITISGGSVKAFGYNKIDIIGGGSRRSNPNAVIPLDKDENKVFLLTIANPNNEVVKIDGEQYPLMTHSETDTNLYVYLLGMDHVVEVGDFEIKYKYSSDDMHILYMPEVDDFVFFEPSEPVYDGNAKNAMVEPKNVITGIDKVLIKYYDEDGNQVADAVNAGSYTVKIDILSNDSCMGVIDITDEEWKFTIAKAKHPILIESYSKTIADESFVLEEITNNYADLNVTYEVVEGTEVISVENGIVNILGIGTAKIKVSIPETDNYSATDKIITVEITKSFVEMFVERMYTVVLGREADELGKANWISVLNLGIRDGAGLAAEFIFGEEFKMRELTDEQYVDILYQTFFDRTADEGGKKFWMSVLALGYTREYVLSNFVNLPEFTMLCDSYGIERGVMLENGDAVNPGIPQFVKRMYTVVLGREAENEGLYNHVLALVVRAVTAEKLAENFFTSAEYVLKNKSTEEYVTDLYLTFMNRDADAEGLGFWVSCIEEFKIMTRTDVLSEFAKSEEFKAIASSYGLE